jgi:hypothetical protein
VARSRTEIAGNRDSDTSLRSRRPLSDQDGAALGGALEAAPVSINDDSGSPQLGPDRASYLVSEVANGVFALVLPPDHLFGSQSAFRLSTVFQPAIELANGPLFLEAEINPPDDPARDRIDDQFLELWSRKARQLEYDPGA